MKKYIISSPDPRLVNKVLKRQRRGGVRILQILIIVETDDARRISNLPAIVEPVFLIKRGFVILD